MELTLEEQFELESLSRTIDSVEDLTKLRFIAKDLLRQNKGLQIMSRELLKEKLLGSTNTVSFLMY